MSADDLFAAQRDEVRRAGAPLAARMRPRTLDEVEVVDEASVRRDGLGADAGAGPLHVLALDGGDELLHRPQRRGSVERSPALADAGRVLVAGEDMVSVSESTRDRLRARHVGYVFQTFHLLQGYTALENVLLAMAFAGSVDERAARELLGRVGLDERVDYRPGQLSVGQQ